MVSETDASDRGKTEKKSLGLLIMVAAFLSAIFSLLGLLLVACLIPLQWVYYKAGPRAAAVCGGISLVLMVGVRVVVYRISVEQLGALALFDYALPVALVSALAVLNLRAWGQQTIKAWLRVALAYGVLALIMGISGYLTFSQIEARTQISKVLAESFTAFGLGSVDQNLLNPTIDLTISCLPFMLTAVVLFNWYAATWFWRKRLFQWTASTALANFRVAEYMVWPLLVGLAAMAAGWVASLPSLLESAVIMVTLGSVFLFFLQGMGIIANFFERRRNPGVRGIALPLVCVILFLLPVVNLFAMVAIPLLGVLEIWIRMRPVTQTLNGNQS